MNTLDTIERLAASWHRARAQEDDFSLGRCAGYAFAIALLLDRPTSEINEALQKGEL